MAKAKTTESSESLNRPDALAKACAEIAKAMERLTKIAAMAPAERKKAKPKTKTKKAKTKKARARGYMSASEVAKVSRLRHGSVCGWAKDTPGRPAAIRKDGNVWFRRSDVLAWLCGDINRPCNGRFPRFLTVDEVAKMAKVTPGSIRSRCKHGPKQPYPTRVTGRLLFERHDVLDWIKGSADAALAAEKAKKEKEAAAKLEAEKIKIGDRVRLFYNGTVCIVRSFYEDSAIIEYTDGDVKILNLAQVSTLRKVK